MAIINPKVIGEEMETKRKTPVNRDKYCSLCKTYIAVGTLPFTNISVCPGGCIYVCFMDAFISFCVPMSLLVHCQLFVMCHHSLYAWVVNPDQDHH